MTDPLDRLIRDLSRMHGAAAVGALDEENARKLLFAEFGTVRRSEDGTTVVHSKPRPTLSVATDAARPSIERSIARRVCEVMDGRSNATGAQIVGAVGRDLAEQVQERIDGNTPPPLASSTLAARRRRGQGDRTLVATGDMLRGIGVEVSADAGRYDEEG